MDKRLRLVQSRLKARHGDEFVKERSSREETVVGTPAIELGGRTGQGAGGSPSQPEFSDTGEGQQIRGVVGCEGRVVVS